MSTKKQKSDKVNKPVADERFARMFTDASFQSVAATSSVDEYGRRKKKSSGRTIIK
jgi:hypothetical protein